MGLKRERDYLGIYGKGFRRAIIGKMAAEFVILFVLDGYRGLQRFQRMSSGSQQNFSNKSSLLVHTLSRLTLLHVRHLTRWEIATGRLLEGQRSLHALHSRWSKAVRFACLWPRLLRLEDVVLDL